MNSNNPFLTPIVLRPDRSRGLFAALCAVHFTTLLIIPWLALGLLSKGLLGLAVVLSAVHGGEQQARNMGDGIVEATLYPNGDWFVCTAKHAACPAKAGGTAFVQAWLTVIEFRLTDGRRRVLILVPDNIPADPFRRLRVRLRCGQSEQLPQ